MIPTFPTLLGFFNLMSITTQISLIMLLLLPMLLLSLFPLSNIFIFDGIFHLTVYFTSKIFRGWIHFFKTFVNELASYFVTIFLFIPHLFLFRRTGINLRRYKRHEVPLDHGRISVFYLWLSAILCRQVIWSSKRSPLWYLHRGTINNHLWNPLYYCSPRYWWCSSVV